MSDPVTNVEIEDVLSSIRRLVSEDSRPAPAEQNPVSDRLVLTPALRVADTAPDDVETAPEAPQQTAPLTLEQPSVDAAEVDDTQHAAPADSDGDTTPSLEDRIAELETVVASSDDQWEPDGDVGDAYAGETGEALPWEDHFEEESDAEDFEPAFEIEEAQDDPETDHGEEFHEENNHDEHPQDADPDAAAEGQEDAEQDLHSEEPAAMEEPADDHPAEMVDMDEGNNALDLSEAAAMPETATDEPAPETDSRAAEAQATEAPQEAPMAADVPTDGDLDLFAADEAILDEETLRELVADIVRQELQGALGERITRNVRKLVRREIHRALASHELD